MVRCAIYVRVSTRDQRLAQQFRETRSAVEARGWRVVAIYRERASGIGERPAWERLRKDAARRRFGAVAVWKLDRMGRSSLDILTSVKAFRDRGIRLLSASDSFEFDGPMGNVVLAILAALAELERDLISERTRTGLEGARNRGTSLGRPRKTLAPDVLQAVRDGEQTAAAAARTLGVSARTVRRALAAAKTGGQHGPGKRAQKRG